MPNQDATWGNVWRVAVSGGAPVQVTTTGGILGLCTQTHPSLPLLAAVLGQGPGAIALVRIGADGSLHTVWDKSTPGVRGTLSSNGFRDGERRGFGG